MAGVLTAYPSTEHLTLHARQETEIEPGPPIISAGVSPDGRLLTLQRSPMHLEFVARDSPNMFLQV
jgi:hypothetical protein